MSQSASISASASYGLLTTTESIPEIAQRLTISETTVSKYRALFEETGSVENNIQGSGHGRFLPMPESHIAALNDIALANPTFYLGEYSDALVAKSMYNEAVGKPWDKTTICRALARLQLTVKKLKYISHNIDEAEKASFRRSMSAYNAEQLLFLDETKRNYKNTRRTKGRARRGEQPIVITVPGTGPAHTILALCSIEGFLTWKVLEHGYDSDSFIENFEILPRINEYPNPNSVLVLDNCQIHHTHSQRGSYSTCSREGREGRVAPNVLSPLESNRRDVF